MKSFMKPCKTETDQGSSTTTSDPARKRKCKPLLPCAACRRRRLRCDRALPACGNCLDNLPLTESCDYSLTRDYLELLNSRQKTKRLRRDKPSLPTPDPSTASPPPKIKEEEDDGDSDDDIDGSVTSATSSTTHDDGDDEDSDSTTKTAHDGLRQKLDRLERLINGLVESHKSCCESKKKQKDLEKAGKLQSRASEEDLVDNHSNAADDDQSANSRVGESAWGSFVSEKVTTWQQKLARHPASERSLEHTSSKEHLNG